MSVPARSSRFDVAGRDAEAPEPRAAPGLAPGIQQLLDHVAAQLAADYVRLMKAAAAGDLEPEDGP